MQASTTAQLRRLLWKLSPHILRLHTLATVFVTLALFLVLLRGASQSDLEPIPVQALADPTASLSVSEANDKLTKAPTALSVPTKRATTPFWLRLTLDGTRRDEVVLIGDKQITSIEAWLLDEEGRTHYLGTYSRESPPVAPFDRSSNVVAVTIPYTSEMRQVLVARVTSRASSTLTATGGSVAHYLDYKLAHERAAATLAGGLGLLAVFSGLVAYFAGIPLFVTFAVWLVSSIAVSGVFFEYDYLWFGVWAPPAVELRAKLLIVTLYALTTTYMFMHLFRRGLARSGMLRPFRWLIVSNALLALASVAMPAEIYLPIFWCFVAAAFGTSIVAMVRIIRKTALGNTPGWYAAGWGVQVGAGLAEVFYAAGIAPRIPGLSFQSGILISCLITGLAAADNLRLERLRRKRAQKQAGVAAKEYRRIYDTVAIGIATVDASGRIVLANQALREMFPEFGIDLPHKNYYLKDLVGDLDSEILSSAIRQKEKLSFQTFRGVGELRKTYSVDSVASIAGVELTFTDTTSATRLTETLKHQSEHDPLTGLANRRGLELAMQRTLCVNAGAQRSCIAYVDLDRFRVINEFFGYATGDAILTEAARRLRASVSPTVSIGRIGGDEFIAVLPGMSRPDAQALINGVLDRLSSSPYEVDGKALSISACAGLIELSSGLSLVDAIAFADRACAIAKLRGKGMVACLDHSDTILTEYRAKNALGTEIRGRLPVERLRLYSQPIVALDSTDPRPCFEVLLRVADDTGKIVSPGKLIQVAEQQGLMADVDRFVLRKTLEHLSSNITHARRIKFEAVNFSGMSLNDERFIADAISMLREHESIARHLMIEITESVALSDIDSSRRFVDQMRSLGARVALDDFGAGYTSFTYLKSFPASLVKIDGSFIRDLNRHPANYAITRAVTALCHELKIQCVAEWVEDVDTLIGLLEVEVDYAQGYVFSEAKPIDFWLSNGVETEPLKDALATYVKQAPFRRRAAPATELPRHRGA